MVRWIALILWCAAACGSISPSTPHDAGIDMAVDSPSPPIIPPPLREAREFVGGGARMTGGAYTFDIQIGHAMQQGKASGATYKLEGNAAVKP